MNNEQKKADLTEFVGDLDYDILSSIFDLDDDRVGNALMKFHISSVKWLAEKAALALQGMVTRYPDHKTPIHYRSTLANLARVSDVATGTKDWVQELWESSRYDDLIELTISMLMALKHFGEGTVA